MGRHMQEDKPFRVKVYREYVNPTDGQMHVIETYHGPYDSLSMAKTQARAISKRLIRHQNLRVTCEQVSDWTEVYEHVI